MKTVKGVRYSDPFNSTFFTQCCGLAINDNESKCPGCQALVVGHDAETVHETRMIRSRLARVG